MSPVTLNFINNSNDENNSHVVIFESVGEGLLSAPAPWTLHLNCPPDSSFEFILPRLDAGLPYINVGLASDSGLDETSTQELSLEGIGSADLILTGGGNVPIEFTLQKTGEVS